MELYFGSEVLAFRAQTDLQKKGRPANSSLRSRKEDQKRHNRQSTDEENPRGGKTRLIADVMAR